MHITKVIEVDAEAVVVLPDELVDRWGLQAGGELEARLEGNSLILMPPPGMKPVGESSRDT